MPLAVCMKRSLCPKKRPPEWVRRCLWGWGAGELVTGEGFQGTRFLKRPVGLESRFACPQSPLPQSPRQPRPWSGGWGGGEGGEVPHLLLGLFWPLEAAEISTRALRPRGLSLPSPALPAARLTPHHEREWVVFADND